jgi:hypothetical protein
LDDIFFIRNGGEPDRRPDGRSVCVAVAVSIGIAVAIDVDIGVNVGIGISLDQPIGIDIEWARQQRQRALRVSEESGGVPGKTQKSSPLVPGSPRCTLKKLAARPGSP